MTEGHNDDRLIQTLVEWFRLMEQKTNFESTTMCLSFQYLFSILILDPEGGVYDTKKVTRTV